MTEPPDWKNLGSQITTLPPSLANFTVVKWEWEMNRCCGKSLFIIAADITYPDRNSCIIFLVGQMSLARYTGTCIRIAQEGGDRNILPLCSSPLNCTLAWINNSRHQFSAEIKSFFSEFVWQSGTSYSDSGTHSKGVNCRELPYSHSSDLKSWYWKKAPAASLCPQARELCQSGPSTGWLHTLHAR